MKLSCLSYIAGSHENQRRIYLKSRPATLSESDSVGKLYWRYGPEGRNDKIEGGNPFDKKRSLRSDVEKMKQGGKNGKGGDLGKFEKHGKKGGLEAKPLPIQPKKKDRERLKRRLENKDIFGNRETQEYYVNNVRESLEKIDPDKLHRFIIAHPTYNKGAHTKWNEDLAQLLAISVDEKYKGRDKAHTNRRVAAALQVVLVEYYKNDVFQITKEDVNPWIKIDGKLGPYSVSVLGEYWTHKYGPQSKLRDPDRSKPSKQYDRKSHDQYVAAEDYLDGQLAVSEKPAAENPEAYGEKRDTVKELREAKSQIKREEGPK